VENMRREREDGVKSGGGGGGGGGVTRMPDSDTLVEAGPPRYDFKDGD
jgi:hypothetical protein